MFRFHQLLTLLALSFVLADAKLPVAIYYESLCPDSVRFITNQLYPSYEYLKDMIDILFVPFGKSSSVNNGESFTCQHGPEECFGNTIQSCVLNELQGQPDLQMFFVACQMKYGAEQTGEKCSNQVGVAWEAVLQCYNGGLGTRLQLEAEKLTKVISPKFVPTIVYNNVFDQIKQDQSLNDFMFVVCSFTKTCR